MKPLKQTEDFLKTSPVKSENDWILIKSYLEKQYLQNFELSPNIDENTGVSCIDFVEWFSKGYSNGDMVLFQDDACIVSDSTLNTVTIAVRICENGILSEKITVNIDNVSPLHEETIRRIKLMLYNEGLQYNPGTCCLIERYIPQPGSRIVFTCNTGKIYGIMREIDMEQNKITMYCYWNYNTGEIFHSMHDTLQIEPTVEFEIMSAGMYRRMKAEMGKIGFDWNDKIGRVEPVQGKVPVGKAYYHFSDKMKVCKAIEKGGRVSHEHWLAGNYFWNINEALEAQGNISEYLRDRLAKTKRGN